MATHSCNLTNGGLSGARFAGGHVLLNWSELAASGLVLYHLNEGTGTSVADSSGNANDATLSGATWNSSPWMGASAMGASRTLTPGAVPTLGTSDWTTEGWIYFASDPNNSQTYVWSKVSGPTGQYWQMTVRYLATTPRIGIGWHDNSTHADDSYGGVAASSLPAWFHVACVRQGNNARLYINGVQVWTYTLTGSTWSAWTGRYWATDAYITSIDEIRDSATAVYPNGTTFYPVRYPASGTWTEASGEAQPSCLPGVLTVTLNAALPTGTSLKCKLLGQADTGWQTMTGSATTYTYDFTGQAAGTWYAAVELFSGGTMNVNTPEVNAVTFDYSAAGIPMGLFVEPFYRSGAIKGW